MIVLIRRSFAHRSFSIEMYTSNMALADDRIKVVQLPYYSTGLGFLKNVLWIISKKFDDKVLLFGDVSYLAPFVHSKGEKFMTILDFVYLKNQKYLKRKLLYLFYFKVPSLFVQKIIFISEAMRREVILNFSEKLSNSIVIPFNGNLELREIARELTIDSRTKYFSDNYLIVGTAPNKNVLNQIIALDEVGKRLNRAMNLTVVGELDPAILFKIASLDFVILTHFIKLEVFELANLYAKSHCLLFASFYEGFGAPILEAGYFSTIVITSNRDPMKDVINNKFLLCNPEDIESIADTIFRVKAITSEEYSAICLELKRNAEKFNYSNIAKQYLSL
jgi:glycosyltransferase involved in cell wall biosynthesis